MLGEQLKLAALEEVEEHADPAWFDIAMNVVTMLAAMGKPFTTDEVWSRLNDWECREPRAMGAVMRKAALAKIIEPTGDYRKSVRAANHARPVAIWRGV